MIGAPLPCTSHRTWGEARHSDYTHACICVYIYIYIYIAKGDSVDVGPSVRATPDRPALDGGASTRARERRASRQAAADGDAASPEARRRARLSADEAMRQPVGKTARWAHDAIR